LKVLPVGALPGFLNCSKDEKHLQPVTVTGTVSGGTDTVMLSTASGAVYGASNPSIAGLAQGWTGTEFNVVGDCCASEIFFASNSTLNVRVGK
jgi:hypothetical protein